MKWNSISETYRLDDPKQDYRSAGRIEQYRISENALYLIRGRYIPFEAVKRAWIQRTELHTTGCCGKGVPAFALGIVYEAGPADPASGGSAPAGVRNIGPDGPVEKVVFEKRKNAEEVLRRLSESEYQIPVEDRIG